MLVTTIVLFLQCTLFQRVNCFGLVVLFGVLPPSRHVFDVTDDGVGDHQLPHQGAVFVSQPELPDDVLVGRVPPVCRPRPLG